MKYWKSLLLSPLLPETYFPKSGMLPALVSLPLKGLLYEVHAVAPSPPAGRTAVVLRARAATDGVLEAAARRHAREALVRGAIVIDSVVVAGESCRRRTGRLKGRFEVFSRCCGDGLPKVLGFAVVPEAPIRELKLNTAYWSGT